MGITKRDSTLLFYAKNLGVSYKKTLMLGRLSLFATKNDIQHCITKYKNNSKGVNDVDFSDGYSEPIFKILGAETVESMDFSDYEKATVIHDLNQPIDPKYHDQFTCIVDGGTIEHVFNFPVAIQNCMKALKVGGHYIGITPTNNQLGHGFYQFSPELYYRVFSEENGFIIKKMFIAPSDNAVKEKDAAWYEVADPKKVNSRVMLTNNFSLSLMFVAEKVQAKEIFEKTPQQIDYVSTWDDHKSLAENKKATNTSAAKLLYRKFLPQKMRMVLSNILDLYRIEKLNKDGLGTINPEHFRKVEV